MDFGCRHNPGLNEPGAKFCGKPIAEDRPAGWPWCPKHEKMVKAPRVREFVMKNIEPQSFSG